MAQQFNFNSNKWHDNFIGPNGEMQDDKYQKIYNVLHYTKNGIINMAQLYKYSAANLVGLLTFYGNRNNY